MRKVEVRLASDSYSINIGSALLMSSGRQLKEMGFSDKLVIVTNPIVRQLYGEALKENLSGEGFRAIILSVPDGEEQKSLGVAGRLYAELASFYVERTTPILALGGGVIGDLAGFVAATYLRGVPLIHIPTTLLAQVDSSIGGKVAVNLGQVKNKIGAFYQPRLVISDINTLKTLPAKEFLNGLAEIIKYAMACDRQLFTLIEDNLDRVKWLDDGLLEEVVFRCARIKAGIVEKDERDLGIRAILNYGHTIGHAIESASDFAVKHGEAIAVGMLIEAKISQELDILEKSDLIRLKDIISGAGLPTKVPGLKPEEILPVIKHDKKILRGRTRFVLPRAIGDSFITDEVSPSLAEQVLAGWNEET